MKNSVISQEAAEWASAALVFVCGAAAGHYAQQGMSMTQWAGAVVAVLGSITVAVAIRVWPSKAVSQDAGRDRS